MPIRANLVPGDSLENAVKNNASATAQQLSARSDVLAKAVEMGNLQIVAGYFDIASGKVSIV
jgi:carbonic anhydrase